MERIPIGHYPRSRFGGLCDLLEKIEQYEFVKDNKWGASLNQFWHAKLGLSKENVHMLRNRKASYIRGKVFYDNIRINGIVYRAIREFKDVWLPKYFKLRNNYWERPPTEKRAYLKERIWFDTHIKASNNGRLTPRTTIKAPITEEVSDILLDLLELTGLKKTRYMSFCKAILGEATEMSLIIGRNPALTRADRLGLDKKRAPCVYIKDTERMISAYGDMAPSVLKLFNEVPHAYQGDVMLRLVKWWLEMLMDGTLAAARQGNVLKYRHYATNRLHKLSPDLIRRAIMERKTRTEASIPAIAVTRKELIKSGYEVVKNKEGKGFILSREGFKLSGLTGREVYIASIIIKQERKFYYDTAYIAEAVAAAAQRQNQSSNSEAGQDQSKD